MVADPDLTDAVARSFLGTLPPEPVDELLPAADRDQRLWVGAAAGGRAPARPGLRPAASGGRLVATAPDRVVIVDAVTDIRRRRRQSACVSLIESQLMRRQPWQPFRTP
jgi:hypothetical protein